MFDMSVHGFYREGLDNELTEEKMKRHSCSCAVAFDACRRLAEISSDSCNALYQKPTCLLLIDAYVQ
jgi:hypothetical protein